MNLISGVDLLNLKKDDIVYDSSNRDIIIIDKTRNFIEIYTQYTPYLKCYMCYKYEEFSEKFSLYKREISICKNQ